ncbi:MAG: sulfurtransferase, partial [Polaromonas sp.]|nr:sulfurtransferase [Polaromonas sp.]
LEFKMSMNPALQSRDLKIVLYCRTSGRAALAAASLQEMGYLNIKSIAGGFEAWKAANKPVAMPDTPNFG